MGLSASAGRMIFLTQRANSETFKLQNIACNRMQLSRQTEDIEAEYNRRLAATGAANGTAGTQGTPGAASISQSIVDKLPAFTSKYGDKPKFRSVDVNEIITNVTGYNRTQFNNNSELAYLVYEDYDGDDNECSSKKSSSGAVDPFGSGDNSCAAPEDCQDMANAWMDKTIDKESNAFLTKLETYFASSFGVTANAGWLTNNEQMNDLIQEFKTTAHGALDKKTDFDGYENKTATWTKADGTQDSTTFYENDNAAMGKSTLQKARDGFCQISIEKDGGSDDSSSRDVGMALNVGELQRRLLSKTLEIFGNEPITVNKDATSQTKMKEDDQYMMMAINDKGLTERQWQKSLRHFCESDPELKGQEALISRYLDGENVSIAGTEGTEGTNGTIGLPGANATPEQIEAWMKSKKNEIKRKEDQLDMQKTKTEVSLQAVQAEIQSIQNIVNKNISQFFTYGATG